MNKRRLLRYGLIGGVILGLLYGAVMLFASGEASDVTVWRQAEVQRGSLERTVSSTGTLAAVETVTIGTEVSGTIEQVLADFNDTVHKGQVLAALKQDLFVAAVDEAQAGVDRARADLQLAESELERNRALYDKGYLTEQEFLPLQIDAQKSRAALASATASLKRARTNQRNAVIRSPIDGTVIQRSVDAGQTVAASLNTPELFVIARDLKRMQIEADVDETDIGQIAPGQQVRFTVQSYPERNFTGQVLQVRLQPETVQNVVTYTVIVEAGNNEGLLLPGMTATVDFVVERIEDALLVPNAALRFTPDGEEKQAKNGGARVWQLATTGGLQPLTLKVLASDGQQSAVEAGPLQSGDRVVVGVAESGAAAKQGFSLFGAMRGRPRK